MALEFKGRVAIHRPDAHDAGPVSGRHAASLLRARRGPGHAGASEGAPTSTVLCAGAGGFEAAHVTLTPGAFIGAGPDAPEQLAARLAQVTERHGDIVPGSGAVQGANEMRLARGA